MTYFDPTPRVRLPQDSMILPGAQISSLNLSAAAASAGVANQAYYQPFVMPYTATLLSMSFSCLANTNSHDLGIYQGTTRLTSRGPTASVAASVNTWTLGTPIVLQEGVQYFAAFATAGTKTVTRFAGTSLVNPRTGRMIQTGLTANTLPNPAVFAVAAADGVIPVLKLIFQA